jgi:hypothetical protein
MLQRRIKKRKSRRSGTRQMQMQMQMRGGSGGQVPLQPQPAAVQTVPQHGTSCTAGDTNCPGNITQGILSVNAQAVANSHGDNVSAPKV